MVSPLKSTALPLHKSLKKHNLSDASFLYSTVVGILKIFYPGGFSRLKLNKIFTLSPITSEPIKQRHVKWTLSIGFFSIYELLLSSV